MAKAPKSRDHYDTVLARNMRQLCERYGSVNAFRTRFKLNQTTINRIANGEVSPSVATLTKISDKCGYSEWQLLHPDFNPRAMPPASDERAMRVAATFASIRDANDKDKAEALVEQFANFGDGPAPAPEPRQPQHQGR